MSTCLRSFTFALSIAVQLSSGPLSAAETPQRWSWPQPDAVDSRPVQLEMLVVGKVRGRLETPGVQVCRKDAGFGNVQVYEIEILDIIKGQAISPNDVIAVVVIPETTDIAGDYGSPPSGWSDAETIDYHRQTGRFPEGTRARGVDPRFRMGEELVFALFKPEIRTDYQEIVWSRADELVRIPNLYGFTLSIPLGEDRQVVGVLRHYAEIDAV